MRGRTEPETEPPELGGAPAEPEEDAPLIAEAAPPKPAFAIPPSPPPLVPPSATPGEPLVAPCPATSLPPPFAVEPEEPPRPPSPAWPRPAPEMAAPAVALGVGSLTENKSLDAEPQATTRTEATESTETTAKPRANFICAPENYTRGVRTSAATRSVRSNLYVPRCQTSQAKCHKKAGECGCHARAALLHAEYP